MRLVYVQVLGADRYVAYGEEQRIEPIEVAGGRGAIYDRNGNDLAISIPRTTVAADPSIVADPAAAARRLAPVLGLDRAELAHDLADEGRFVYLARQVDDEVAEKVAELGIDGVITFDEQTRFSPSDDLALALSAGSTSTTCGLSGIEGELRRPALGRVGAVHRRAGEQGPHHPRRPPPDRAGRQARRRPRPHHRPQPAVRGRR